MVGVLLAVLGMAACVAGMAIAYWLIPRLVRRGARIQRLADRAAARPVEDYTLYPVRWRDGARVYELSRSTSA